MALGATISDLPLGVNPERLQLAYTLLPTGEPMVADEDKQFCPVGEFSDDPLIPGVCNPTVLAGAAVFLLVLWFLGRRG